MNDYWPLIPIRDCSWVISFVVLTQEIKNPSRAVTKIELIMKRILPLPEALSRMTRGKSSVSNDMVLSCGPESRSPAGLPVCTGFLPLLPGSAIYLLPVGLHTDQGAVSHVFAQLFSFHLCLHLNWPRKRFWNKRGWVNRTVFSPKQLSWLLGD